MLLFPARVIVVFFFFNIFFNFFMGASRYAAGGVLAAGLSLQYGLRRKVCVQRRLLVLLLYSIVVLPLALHVFYVQLSFFLFFFLIFMDLISV